MNLRRMRSAGAATLAVAVAAGCGDDGVTKPAPPTSGAVRASVLVFGPPPEDDGHTLTLEGRETGETALARVEPAGGTVVFLDLAPDRYTVRLRVLGACAPEGTSRLSVDVGPGEVLPADFTVGCPVPGASAAYERRGEGPYDRFYLLEDGTFTVTDGGSWGRSGTYEVTEGGYVFTFDYVRDWGEDGQARGRLGGDCMEVTFGAILSIDGHQDGTYCRLPAP